MLRQSIDQVIFRWSVLNAKFCKLNVDCKILDTLLQRWTEEDSESDGPKKLPVQEIACRFSALEKKLGPLKIERVLEPSHSLINSLAQCTDDGRLRYIELSKCTSRSAELKNLKEQNSLKVWKADASGTIKQFKKQLSTIGLSSSAQEVVTFFASPAASLRATTSSTMTKQVDSVTSWKRRVCLARMNLLSKLQIHVLQRQCILFFHQWKWSRRDLWHQHTASSRTGFISFFATSSGRAFSGKDPGVETLVEEPTPAAGRVKTPPFLLELFYGTAGVCAQFRAKGGRALGIDHHLKRTKLKSAAVKLWLDTSLGARTDRRGDPFGKSWFGPYGAPMRNSLESEEHADQAEAPEERRSKYTAAPQFFASTWFSLVERFE